MNNLHHIIDDAARGSKPRRRHADNEHKIQVQCVKWFGLQHPHLHGRLVAVPNGGRRDVTTGRRLKEEGVVAGVADLVLFCKRGPFGALFLEMKTPEPKSVQSYNQKQWQHIITQDNEYKYVICRSLDDFIREVNLYLSL